MKSIYLLLVGLLFSVPAYSEDFSLDQLMHLFASQTSMKAQFSEEKFDSFLEIPLQMSGQVSFISPDYLEKTIYKPSPQSFIMNGDKITISVRQKPAKTYSLDKYPAIRAFSESFRSTLSGDLKTLQTYYNVEFEGQAEDWTMLLRPINKSMSRAIDKIQFNGALLDGTQQQLTRVTTWQKNGDHSVMTFLPQHSTDAGNE